ncbi:MAG TPA: AbgT family transporter [Azospirillaceae bacterium]|nr:AbgT family transporter [Azospirillaceae bacterium]
MTAIDTTARRSLTDRFLDRIEKAGNRLPDAVTLFLYLITGLLLISAVASWFGAAVEHPTTKAVVPVVNLLSDDSIRRWLAEFPSIFANFAPLGMVLVAMVGVGMAEKSGLIATSLSSLVRSVPKAMLTLTIVFAGVMSSLAVDAGYVVLVPLGAALFAAVGRHPIAGLAAGFAGVSGGFSANLLITPLDAQLAGLTEPAARLIDPAVTVPITANFYLMAALVPLFTIVGTIITERLVEPRLGAWAGSRDTSVDPGTVTDVERRGLRNAGLVLAAIVALVAVAVVPAWGPLRGPNGELTQFFKGLVTILMAAFVLMAITYGRTVGTIRSERDAVKMAGQSMSDLGYYIVLVMAIAQFVQLFGWSNLGVWLAVNGAGALKAAGLTGAVLIVLFIILTCLINLLIGSASAKWALLAPVFVPVFMLLGFTPDFAQAVYRIGDAFTNIITPLNVYFAVVIVFAQRYVPGFGIGSLVSVMLPYCLWFGIASTLMTLGWYWLDLPLGPGSYIHPAKP